MPSITDLAEQFKAFGYDVTLQSTHNYFEATGGKLEDVQVWARWREDFCTIGLLVGVLESVPERFRYNLLIDLLELNFTHPLGRLCLVRGVTSEKETRPSIILAETSFFTTGLTKEKVDGRMRALRAIALAASKLLAIRGAIANTNPFYSQLKPIIPVDPEKSLAT